MEDFEGQVKTLLEQAMKQPGVAEIMQSYEPLRTVMESLDRAQQALAPRWVVSSSASTSTLEM